VTESVIASQYSASDFVVLKSGLFRGWSFCAVLLLNVK